MMDTLECWRYLWAGGSAVPIDSPPEAAMAAGPVARDGLDFFEMQHDCMGCSCVT